jgi:hypothetical protein
MTATETEDGSKSPAAPTAPGGSSLPPAAEAVVRRRRVQTRQRRLTTWGAVATVVSLILLGGLAFVGYQASLRMGGGTESKVSDPAAPGYVAEPRSTPTDLYVFTDDAGDFSSALIVVPDASGQGGKVVPLPPSFVVPEYEGSPPLFLGDLYAEGGIDGFRDRVGIALRFGIDSVETVPAAALAQLADGAAVEIENVDSLVARAEDGSEEVLYPAGPLTIEPADLAAFLSFEGADDPAPNQALRIQTIWEELLARAGTAPVDDLPEGDRAEGSEGPTFAETLRGLVAGEVTLDLVPMQRVPVPDSYLVAWMPDEANLDAFVARAVPLPRTPAPGVRTAVSILNGTKSPDVITAMVPVVVTAGGEVALVGNAASFDVVATTVEFSGEGATDTANEIATALGITATAVEGTIEGASVRVILGSDRAQ